MKWDSATKRRVASANVPHPAPNSEKLRNARSWEVSKVVLLDFSLLLHNASLSVCLRLQTHCGGVLSDQCSNKPKQKREKETKKRKKVRKKKKNQPSLQQLHFIQLSSSLVSIVHPLQASPGPSDRRVQRSLALPKTSTFKLVLLSHRVSAPADASSLSFRQVLLLAGVCGGGEEKLGRRAYINILWCRRDPKILFHPFSSFQIMANPSSYGTVFLRPVWIFPHVCRCFLMTPRRRYKSRSKQHSARCFFLYNMRTHVCLNGASPSNQINHSFWSAGPHRTLFKTQREAAARLGLVWQKGTSIGDGDKHFN